MEDIYWELAGSGDPGETSQLLLLGMMIKKAEIEIDEKEVRLKLYKGDYYLVWRKNTILQRIRISSFKFGIIGLGIMCNSQM